MLSTKKNISAITPSKSAGEVDNGRKMFLVGLKMICRRHGKKQAKIQRILFKLPKSKPKIIVFLFFSLTIQFYMNFS
jgi:hypothetical protein